MIYGPIPLTDEEQTRWAHLVAEGERLAREPEGGRRRAEPQRAGVRGQQEPEGRASGKRRGYWWETN